MTTRKEAGWVEQEKKWRDGEERKIERENDNDSGTGHNI
jgi:hypothetical protein